MIVKDLNNNEYKINLRNYGNNRVERSSLHLQARDFLQKVFSPLFIFEEVPIKVLPKKTLYIDFWIEKHNKLYEVQGKQHFEYSSLYHSTKLDLINQRKNDMLKQQWVEINGFTLVLLTYDKIGEWEKIINQR